MEYPMDDLRHITQARTNDASGWTMIKTKGPFREVTLCRHGNERNCDECELWGKDQARPSAEQAADRAWELNSSAAHHSWG